MRHEKLTSGEQMVKPMNGGQITNDILRAHNIGRTTPVSLQQTRTLTSCKYAFSHATNSNQGLSLFPINEGEKSPKHSMRQNDVTRAAT